MALSNRDRIDRMFEVLAPALDDFIASVVGQGDPALGAVWTKLVQAKDSKNGAPSTKMYDAARPAGAVPDADRATSPPASSRAGTRSTRHIGRAGETFASELREVRNDGRTTGPSPTTTPTAPSTPASGCSKLIGAADGGRRGQGDPAEPAPGDRRQGRQEGPQGRGRQPRGGGAAPVARGAAAARRRRDRQLPGLRVRRRPLQGARPAARSTPTTPTRSSSSAAPTSPRACAT